MVSTNLSSYMPVIDLDELTKNYGPPIPGFPDEVRLKSGMKIRFQYIMTEGGSYVLQEKPVADTMDEARVKFWDFYHPTVGWIKDGYKIQHDRSIEERLADNSVGGQGRYNL